MTPHTPKIIHPQHTITHWTHTCAQQDTCSHIKMHWPLITTYTYIPQPWHTHTHTHATKKALKTSGLNTTNSWQHTVNTWTMKTWHTQGIKLKPQHNWNHGHTSITHEPARQSDSQQLKTETHNWNTLKDDNTHAHNNKMATAYKVKLSVDTHRTMNTYQMEPITHISCQPTWIKQWQHTNLQAEHQPHITTATD